MTLDLTAQGFSLSNARVLCGASAAAYQSFTIDDQATDTQVLIVPPKPASNNGSPVPGDWRFASPITIAFRGTTDPRDWITDFRAWRHHLQGCSLHSGFYAAVSSALPRILGALKSFDPHTPIFVTGHSLGAALATVFAYRFPETSRIAGVYTFGGPRVGDASFRDLYNGDMRPRPVPTDTNTLDFVPSGSLGSKTYRITHAADIVPWVPPITLGYRHVGVEYFLPSMDSLPPWKAPSIVDKLWSDKLEFLTEFLRLKSGHWQLGGVPELADHPIDRYQEALG